MKASMLWLVMIATLLWCGYGVQGAEKPKGLPELTYAAHPYKWCGWSPSMAYEIFTTTPREPREPYPVVFAGQMVPRGMLSLWGWTGDANPATCPPERRRVMRGKDVDITGCLTLVSAQYRAEGSNLTTYYTSEQLPKCIVQYAPFVPEEVVFPNERQHNACMPLLYSIGEGKEGEWLPGTWNVTLRFNAAPLRVKIKPDGTTPETYPDWKNPEDPSILFKMWFRVKPMETPEDTANYTLFRYFEQKGLQQFDAAMAAMDTVLTSYPRDGRLLYERIRLLSSYNKRAEAIAAAEELVRMAKAGELSYNFHYPVAVVEDKPPTAQQSIALLEYWIRSERGFLREEEEYKRLQEQQEQQKLDRGEK